MKKTATKILSLVLALLMLVIFTACADTPTDPQSPDNGDGTNTPKASVALDLTKEWETLNGENTLVQGCLVVNTAWAAAHPNELARFLADYSASVEYVKSGSDDAINTIVNAGVLPNAAVAKKALPGCNICYIASNDMKPVMNTFCEKIYAYDATSIGGKLPTDEFFYTGTGNAADANKTEEIKIYALNGTTALGMAKIIEDDKNNATDMNYNIELHATTKTIPTTINKGECAIAALPTNVAAKLFNASNGKLQLLAINTLGVLYLLQNGDQGVKALADLKGKTIYLPGPATNPEYITAALLTGAGLEVGKDVTLDTTTYNSPDALATAFAAGLAPLAVLPEPKVTVALSSANAG